MANNLWKILLILRSHLEKVDEEVRFLCLSKEGLVHINELTTDKETIVVFRKGVEPPATDQALIEFSSSTTVSIHNEGNLTGAEQEFLKKYLPYCFLPILAKEKNRTIAVAHFAQSLDGKIATQSGDSKWIGNDENLFHAHRMRALCAGIMVGGNTLLLDKPSLNVRHVEGANPKKIILSSSPCNIASLKCPSNEKVLVIGCGEAQQNQEIDYVQIQGNDGRIACKDILEKLYERGIHSVYIEGGAITTSNFLSDKAVDVLQLHLSPLVFGSGRSGIKLSEIDKVEDSIQFERFTYQVMGDSVMFVGELNS